MSFIINYYQLNAYAQGLIIIIIFSASQKKMSSSLKLTSTTPLGKDELKKINLILQALFDNNESFEFRQPVDWKTLGLTDYPLLVKNPIDLGTIKKKLLSGKYTNAQQVLDDIQLTWDNCKIYNQAGSWIHNIADKLQKSFKKMIKNYLPNINVPLPGKAPVFTTNKQGQKVGYGENQIFQQPEAEEITYQEKLRFSQRIKNLSQEQLGIVVVLIQNICPDAFKEVEKDRAQIIVDNLDNQSFQKVNEKIDEFSQSQNDRVTKKVKV